MERTDLARISPTGRIVFPGNPWPEGHAIEEFAWTGRLDPAGHLWFDLHLQSADYNAERAPEDDAEWEPEDDEDHEGWTSRIVWQNYHRCTLSSTYWGEDEGTGFRAAEPGRPFLLKAAQPQQLTVDPLPLAEFDDVEGLAFNIYLLGHDSVADQEVSFTRRADGRHDIDWQGRIALTYCAQYEFEYGFRARISGATLDFIRFPANISAEQAQQQLTVALDAPEEFELGLVDGQPAWVSKLRA
ncbi:hypothetical protein OHB12_06640 [Nocardia sp. NBC_01730]|uniref:hypothetical protein n=1 Tax=Nocardia sp. NBC_01730 TaxID=2975998 RepID=UPI002E106A17|nr:hypothetical protein OHB12_06640 [Nocardia sp. NBC_01730]